MRLSRSAAVLTAVGVGVALAACSSSKSTGPSAAALAVVFDSSYKADSAAGLSVRSLGEHIALVMLNEGVSPTSGSVTTDAGALSMEMVSLDAYDTSGGVVSDSILVTAGWTSDYSTILVNEFEGVSGPDLVPPHRVRVSAQQMALLRGGMARLHSDGMARVRSGGIVQVAFLAVGPAGASADSVSVSPSVATANGNCAWEGFDTDPTEFASTSPCSRITVTESFALHFPLTAGIDASFSHVTLSPAKTIPGSRTMFD